MTEIDLVEKVMGMSEVPLDETQASQLEPSDRPRISRRAALRLGVTAAAAGTLLALEKNRTPAVQQALAVSPQQATSGAEAHLRTTCALCPSGCGLEVRVVDGRAVKVEGNPMHPLNQGVCCLKGQTSLEVLYSPERLLHPRIQKGRRGSGDWQEISWDEALTLLADKLAALRQSGKPHQLAMLVGDRRGQMRQLLQRFMQAYGSPNLISRESLGEGAARLAMLLSQGVNGLPVYDLNNANYVMTFGGNLLESSRNVIGYLGAAAFMRRGRPQRGKLVAVHPRLSLTGLKADEWVPIRPGTYAALALGMANVIINSQLYDADFVEHYTYGFEDFVDAQGQQHRGFKTLVLEEYGLERVSAITGVATEIIARLAGEFATNRPAVAVMPTEWGELSSGNALYTALAIHALNALVGSIDIAGGVLVQRFPQLADWPELFLDDVARRGLAQERLDGAGSDYPLAFSVYQNVPDRLLNDQPYPIELLMLVGANPVYEVPNGGAFAQALLKVPFVVSLAHTLDESAAHADLVLPLTTFLEEWGDDYLEGTGYAGVSLRRPVVSPVTDSKCTGDILLALAARLGGTVAQSLPWDSYQSLIRQRLSTLDWEKLESNGCWSELVYFHAVPGSQAWSEVVGRDRRHAPQDGRFDLFSRELFTILGAQAGDLACLPHFELPQALAQSEADPLEYPFLLVQQQLITQSTVWQGIVPTLQEAYGLQSHVKWGSWIELNPQAAEGLGLKDGDWVWVESPEQRFQLPVRVYPGLWKNAVYIPPGQGHFTRVPWGRATPGNLQVGVNPAVLARVETEAVSGLAISGPVRLRIVKA